MNFFNTCIIGQAIQLLELFNKNLILIGGNFLYEFFTNMPKQCGLLDEA